MLNVAFVFHTNKPVAAPGKGKSALDKLICGINNPLFEELICNFALGSGFDVPMPTFCAFVSPINKVLANKKVLIINNFIFVFLNL